MSLSRRIVVLGNGGAAAHAIMAARQAGYRGQIHQVSDVCAPSFNPMLAPYYLKGALTWEQCFPFGPAFYDRYDVVCHFGSPAVSLDTVSGTVRLDNGRCLAYDRCLLATGARPVTPPIPGLSGSGFALPLRTPASVSQLEKAMQTARQVIVLGASLVGIKVAEILSTRARVILMDVAPQVLSRSAHPATAALLQQHMERRGIEVRLGCSLEGLEDGQDSVCCFLPGRLRQEADLVAVCTGIRPNADYLDPLHIAMDQAVLVNRRMQTGAQHVYAAGDICQGLERLTGENQWLGTWVNACLQGRVAGLNMAGVETTWPGAAAQHIAPVFDWVYAHIGTIPADDPEVRIETRGDPFADGGRFTLLAYRGDRLVGANLINGTRDIAAIKNAIVLGKDWTRDSVNCILPALMQTGASMSPRRPVCPATL